MSRSRPYAAVCALLLVMLLAPQESIAQDVPPAGEDNVLTYAQQKLETGSYREAAAAAEAILADEPANRAALELLVRAELARGRRAAARELLAEAREDQPGAVDLLLGEVLTHADPRVAEEHFRRAVEREPDSIRARAGLAALLVLRGNREQAREEARKVFSAYRGAPAGALDADALVAMARLARAAELLPELASAHTRPFGEEARRFYQEAFRLRRTDPDILVAWAELYMLKWDIPEARRLLKRALEQNPKHADGQALLAESYLEDLYGGAAGYDKAREALAAALATDAGHPRAHTLRAELLITDGLYDDALRSLSRALQTRPLDPRALAGRVSVLEMLGRDEPARALRTEVGERLSPPMRAEFHRRVAGVLDSRFRYKEAFDEARRAVEADPAYTPAWGRLGLAAMRTGDEKEARTYLEKAHAADPYDLFVFNVLQLLDALDREFITFETKHFIVRMHKDEVPWLRPYLEPFCDRAWEDLAARYGVALDFKILLEVFPNLQDFSVRAVGHRFIPASGVTFWRTVALASPAAFPPGAHGWAQVLWHELAHVATLERSGYRVPRWLTEGVSVMEESKGDPDWVRAWDATLLDAISRDRILGLLALDEGFSKPRFRGQVMLSYFQGGMLCRYLEQTRGFEAIVKLLDGFRARVPLAQLSQRALGIPAEQLDREFHAWLVKELGVARYRGRIDTQAELARLRRRAKRNPTDPEALALYGLACCDMGRWADAEIQAGKLLELDGANGDARLIDARVAMHRGETDKAMEMFAAALAFKTLDPLLAHRARARLFTDKDPKAPERRDLNKALSELRAAQRLFPRSLELLGQLHELLGELGREDEQLALEPDIARLQPNDYEGWLKLAERAVEEGRLAEARGWLEQVLDVEPRHPVVHAELAKLYAKLGEDPALIERELKVLEATDRRGQHLGAARAAVKRLREGGDEPAPDPEETTPPNEPTPPAKMPSPEAPESPTPTPQPVGPFAP